MRRLSPAIFLVLLPFVLNGQQTQYKKGWPRDPGGIRYRKEVTVPEGAGRVFLDLGRIVATCEVKVGGKDAGVMIAPPYRVDVTDLVHPGQNEVEVLVYSTLANHYQTVPTPYRGDPEAGLVGPVKLIVESK